MYGMMPNWKITSVYGCCPVALDGLEEVIETVKPSSLPGDFVLVCEREGEEMLVTSAVAALPYYHCEPSGGGFWHGPNVFDVARKARLQWSWNTRAVNCMAVFEHTLGTDSLHRDVHRVEAATRYLWRGGKLEIQRDDTVEAAYLQPEDSVTPSPAHTALRRAMRELCEGREVALSLSAGYDSRALLAMTLELGCRPTLHTMGQEGATDVRISSAIARDLELPHEVIAVQPEEYLEYGDEISVTTSGEKSAAHWHTWLFSKKASFGPSTLHLAGANGESARSYYFDKGVLAAGLDRLRLPLERPFFRLKYGVGRKWPGEAPASFWAQDEDGTGVSDVIEAATQAVLAGASTFMRRMDHFYTFERVRHFIGQGLASYARFSAVASPFLDACFLQEMARLRRRWKLNSRFHRHVIGQACARLLDYPTDEGNQVMRDADKSLYWLRRGREISYSPLGQVLASARTWELVMDSPHLDLFLSRGRRELLLKRRHGQLLSFLITMHYAAANALKAC